MIIDSHCHLHDPAFEDTRGAVTRATEHDVWGVVAVGCDPDTNRRTLEAAGGERQDGVAGPRLPPRAGGADRRRSRAWSRAR